MRFIVLNLMVNVNQSRILVNSCKTDPLIKFENSEWQFVYLEQEPGIAVQNSLYAYLMELRSD